MCSCVLYESKKWLGTLRVHSKCENKKSNFLSITPTNGFPIPRGTINFIRDRGILSRFCREPRTGILSCRERDFVSLSRYPYRTLVHIICIRFGFHTSTMASAVAHGRTRATAAPQESRVKPENATKRALRCAVLGIFIEEYLPARSKSNAHAEWLCRL